MDVTDIIHTGPWSESVVAVCKELTATLKAEIRKLPLEEAITKLGLLPSGLDVLLTRDVWTLVDCLKHAEDLGFQFTASIAKKYSSASATPVSSTRKRSKTGLRLQQDILKASVERGFNPYARSFRPGELGLIASKYGSFSDHCSEGESKSTKYQRQSKALIVCERDLSGRPRTYRLNPNF